MTATLTHCPTCGDHLGGLGRYCFRCGGYTADMLGATTDGTPANRPDPVKDTRSEAEVQLAIRRLAELLGYTVYDLSQGRPTRQPVGVPDMYLHGHGRRCWIEVKRPDGGRVSPAQHEFIARENGNGGEAFIARTEADFMAWHERRDAA